MEALDSPKEEDVVKSDTEDEHHNASEPFGTVIIREEDDDILPVSGFSLVFSPLTCPSGRQDSDEVSSMRDAENGKIASSQHSKGGRKKASQAVESQKENKENNNTLSNDKQSSTPPSKPNDAKKSKVCK